MNVIQALQQALSIAQKNTVGAVLEAFAQQREKRNASAFSIALIALSAKMAKADGVVTDDEIEAFCDFFSFDEKEGDKVRLIYQLAQQDVAGFDHYLRQVADLYREEPVICEDVLDCLYHIAAADGVAHPKEQELLDRAATILQVSPKAVRRIKALHLGQAEDAPSNILGVTPDASMDEIKAAYRKLVKEHHPDALQARGAPQSMINIAQERMSAITQAYNALTQ